MKNSKHYTIPVKPIKSSSYHYRITKTSPHAMWVGWSVPLVSVSLRVYSHTITLQQAKRQPPNLTHRLTLVLAPGFVFCGPKGQRSRSQHRKVSKRGFPDDAAHFFPSETDDVVKLARQAALTGRMRRHLTSEEAGHFTSAQPCSY